MKKVLYMAAVLLVYCGLWVGADHIEAGTFMEAVWGGMLLFMTDIVLCCLPVVIARYIVKRAPFDNAKQISTACCCIYAGALIKLCDFGLVNTIISSAGIGIASWLNYQMLSK